MKHSKENFIGSTILVLDINPGFVTPDGMTVSMIAPSMVI
jgi:hypothetical protein